MALATQCPHCQTRFRVASDQLKLRGGIVRCGACQRIFDGSAHLIDLEAAREAVKNELPPPALPSALPDVPAPIEQSPMPQEAADAHAPGIEVDVDLPPEDEADEVQPQTAPDMVAPIDALPEPEPEPEPVVPETPALPAAETRAAEPEAPQPVAFTLPPVSFAPQDRIEPSFDLPVDEALVALPLPGHETEAELEPATVIDAVRAVADGTPSGLDPADDGAPPPALPLRASAGGELHDAVTAAPAPAASASLSARARALDARARRTKLTPTRIEAPRLRVPETDEPEFVKRSRKQEQSARTRRILMAAGALVLLLLLAAQLVLNFRNALAARYPGARPALSAACALLRCRIELPTQIDDLAIEDGELTTLGPDTYSLNTLLRNQGSLVQAWPSIELELTDAANKPVLRRVFAPGDYLPQNVTPAVAAAGFGPRSEQAIKLHFALADLKPSGYHTFIFYP